MEARKDEKHRLVFDDQNVGMTQFYSHWAGALERLTVTGICQGRRDDVGYDPRVQKVPRGSSPLWGFHYNYAGELTRNLSTLGRIVLYRRAFIGAYRRQRDRSGSHHNKGGTLCPNVPQTPTFHPRNWKNGLPLRIG